MKLSRFLVALAICCLGFQSAQADLSNYSQDFESMTLSDPNALSNDGWLFFVNQFDGGGGYQGGYGGPAPNGPQMSALTTGEGGPQQGMQQLNIYSDYDNGNHANGWLIETNIYHDQIVGAGDLGSTWKFTFDHKKGNLAGASTASAFIKVFVPDYSSLPVFLQADMTSAPTTWGTSSLEVTIDNAWTGYHVQFGFLNTATNYEGSGVFYDNVSFSAIPEPSSMGVVLVGAVAGLVYRRRR